MFWEIIVFFLHVAAALSISGALVFAFRLYRETDKGWYWLFLLLSAVFFAITQWAGILPPFVRGFVFFPLIKDVSEIAADLLLALSCYGIYKTMMDVRKRVE